MNSWFDINALSIARKFSDVGRLNLIGSRRNQSSDLSTVCMVLKTAVNQNIRPVGLRQAVRCAVYESSLGYKICEELSNAVLNLPEPYETVVPLFEFVLHHAHVHRTPEGGVLRMRQFLWAGCVGYARPGARLPLPPPEIIAELTVVPGDDYDAADFDESRTRGTGGYGPRWVR